MARSFLRSVVLAALTVGVYDAVLGWDHTRHVQADGTTTGPYSAWQVAVATFTLLALGLYAARRPKPLLSIGTVLSLTAATGLDWGSHDSSGLWVIGTGLVFRVSALAGLLLVGLLRPTRRAGQS
jgi:hypothetical protein